jgi:hypothetical protein
MPSGWHQGRRRSRPCCHGWWSFPARRSRLTHRANAQAEGLQSRFVEGLATRLWRCEPGSRSAGRTIALAACNSIGRSPVTREHGATCPLRTTRRWPASSSSVELETWASSSPSKAAGSSSTCPVCRPRSRRAQPTAPCSRPRQQYFHNRRSSLLRYTTNDLVCAEKEGASTGFGDQSQTRITRLSTMSRELSGSWMRVVAKSRSTVSSIET